MERKPLPNGTTWMTLYDLPKHTTEESLQQHFAAAHIHLTLDRIVIHSKATRSLAIVALTHNDIAALVDRALNDSPMGDCIPRVVYKTD